MSVFLLAVGAVMTFALDAEVSGIDLDTIGIILMIVGVIGLVTSMLIFGNRGHSDTTVVREREIL